MTDTQKFPPAEQLPAIGELPDPFIKPDGDRLTDPSQWEKQRDFLKALVSHYMYGPLPRLEKPVAARILESEPCHGNRAIQDVVRISYSFNGDFYFDVRVVRPNREGKHPVIVWNNFWQGPYAASARISPRDEEETVVRRGYVLAEFDREQIAADPSMNPQGNSAAFPALACGSILAWGWGHMLVNDYLVTQPFADERWLVCTGHSRGGKAALAAGIFDERIAICVPMISGCGGAGSLRYIGTKDMNLQDETLCETVGRITHAFPEWFAPEFAEFGSKTGDFYPIGGETERLPFDAHTLRTLIAPRAVLSCNGTDDAWANPAGTQIAWRAAQPVFDFLGVPQNNMIFYRPGGHGFFREDWLAMLDYCDFKRLGTPLPPELNRPLVELDALPKHFSY